MLNPIDSEFLAPGRRRRPAFRGLLPVACLVLLGLLLTVPACLFSHGQRYRHFITSTPLPPQNTLVLGFLGGREPWDNDKRGVRKLALKLRAMNLRGVHVETVENMKRDLAMELIHNSLDRNRDGQLQVSERDSARLILYGQSFGGAAVVKLARQLQEIDVPVLLTVQVDSVGLGDAVIPSNVRRAANLFQNNGLIIQGEAIVRAADPSSTLILGNWRYDYFRREIDLSEVAWWKRLFRAAHTKMDLDPDVWARVESLILEETGGR